MLVTPIKNLPPNPQQPQLTVIDQKQPIPQITNQSITLRTQFLQSKLSLKQKRIQSFQQKLTQQTHKIQQLQQAIVDKQIIITNKIDQITILQKKLSQLQIQLSKYVGKLQDKNRQIYKMDIQIYRDRKQNDYHDKVSKMLTKQNHQLIAQKTNLKLIITQLTQKISAKQRQKQQQIYNNKLLAQLNQTLKLQIQQLLFQIRMLHRKQETTKLNDYEGDVDRRISLMGKYRDNKSIQLKVQQNQDQSQLVNLLKLKINSLQQQLAVSDRRCKQLQTIVLSQ